LHLSFVELPLTIDPDGKRVPNLDWGHQSVVLMLENVTVDYESPDLLLGIETHYEEYVLVHGYWNCVVPHRVR
jgi:hypothetical protein